MKRHEWDRRHVESIVGTRKIVSVRQPQLRREMTTYFGKTGGSCFRERSPPSRSVDGHVIRSVIISWCRKIRVHGDSAPQDGVRKKSHLGDDG
jgi:hypothetical protein